MQEEVVYILLSRNKNIVKGIFKNSILLLSTYKTIKEILPEEDLLIQEIIINTNIIKKTYNEEQLIKLAGLDKVENDLCTDAYPKEIKNEIEKIKVKLSIFKENLKTFDKLLKDKVFSLEETNLENIPLLFRDKFEIFRDIKLNDIPEDEMFSYFMDRFQFQDIVD